MKKSSSDILGNLKKNGYVILKSRKINFLKKIKKDYLRIARKNKFDGSLNSISKISEKSLNQLHIDFNKNSQESNFNLINSFADELKIVLGNKIFIQRQPYLRVKKYNLKSTATIAHNDYDFGHSHRGFNLWAPLFDIKNNEGIYIYDLVTSKKIYKNFRFDCHLSEHIKKINLVKKKKYINLKFGEAIFFSHLCIHGASISQNINRVSTNIHMQNFFEPFNEKSYEFFTIAKLDKNYLYQQTGV
jgi:sporadic carbohydrate cluster 2OG-Fe(II) oxygenase